MKCGYVEMEKRLQELKDKFPEMFNIQTCQFCGIKVWEGRKTCQFCGQPVPLTPNDQG